MRSTGAFARRPPSSAWSGSSTAGPGPSRWQRQAVALGRAIVREPQVFLMDEPLSNLDAKLRVQTRPRSFVSTSVSRRR